MSLQADVSFDSQLGSGPRRHGRLAGNERGPQDPVRVLLVADAEIIVTGVALLLEACRDQIELMGSVSADENVGAAAVTCRADVVLVDADHGGRVDLTLVSSLVGQRSGLRVVVLTQCRDERQLFGALRIGAAGYLLKSLNATELVMHLDRVRDGKVVVDPSMASRLALAVERSSHADGWAGARLGLSRRESDVLGLLTEGLSNREIADQLIVGQETVKTHLRSIYRKLDVADRAGAVARALRTGIFT